MIHPSPTTPIAPTLARGILLESHEASATKPAQVVIEFPNTNYEMHLVATLGGGAPFSARIGKRIVGTIRVPARRVDVVDTGGSYVEPVYGRPRRVQGRVIAIDARHNSVVVDAGVPIHLKLTDARQSPAQFTVGELVSCDVLEGATFTPEG